MPSPASAQPPRVHISPSNIFTAAPRIRGHNTTYTTSWPACMACRPCIYIYTGIVVTFYKNNEQRYKKRAVDWICAIPVLAKYCLLFRRLLWCCGRWWDTLYVSPWYLPQLVGLVDNLFIGTKSIPGQLNWRVDKFIKFFVTYLDRPTNQPASSSRQWPSARELCKPLSKYLDRVNGIHTPYPE